MQPLFLLPSSSGIVMQKTAKHLVMQRRFRSQVITDKRKKAQNQRLSQSTLKNLRREADSCCI
jgi:hypothetical protein